MTTRPWKCVAVQRFAGRLSAGTICAAKGRVPAGRRRPSWVQAPGGSPRGVLFPVKVLLPLTARSTKIKRLLVIHYRNEEYSVVNCVYDIVNPCGNIIVESNFEQLEIISSTVFSFEFVSFFSLQFTEKLILLFLVVVLFSVKLDKAV